MPGDQPADLSQTAIDAVVADALAAFAAASTSAELKEARLAHAGERSPLALANRAIGTLDRALLKVSKQRADLGAYQNRLEFAVKGILVGYENMQSAESRIRDTDMAAEMSDFIKNQILMQSSTSMLGQANMKPQSVLKLLG